MSKSEYESYLEKIPYDAMDWFCIREESMRPYSVFTNAGKLMEKALPDHSRKYLISSC